jgi:hypothetical protein
MKLYHGSPKKFKVLTPMQAKGMDEFQNRKAIFLTKEFKQAALYALGKSLKGRTNFALPKNKLIIQGDFTPLSKGYVYEAKIIGAKKGNFGDYEYAYEKNIKDFKVHKVELKDYEKDIKYVKTKKELFKELKK